MTAEFPPGTRISLLMILALLLVASPLDAADADIHIIQDILPLTQAVTVDVLGTINTTLNVSYDQWLAGPDHIDFTDPLETLTVALTIPNGTASGNYTRTILFSDGTHKSVAIEIMPSQDKDHDGYSPPEDCDDADPQVNPGRQETCYNGKDDDCAAGTVDNYPFTTLLSSTLMNIGEQLSLRIDAPPGANVTVQVCQQGTGFVPCFYPITVPDHAFPTQVLIPFTNTSGDYALTATMKYNQATRTNENDFTVHNSLTVQVEGNTEVDQGKAIVLAAIAGGGASPYTYKWFPEGKSPVDGPLINISYDTNGQRTLTLNVKDRAKNERNTTITTNTKRLYPVTVAIVDNETGARVPNIKVSVRDQTLDTSANGDATFQLSEGTYTFTAFDQNYDYAKVQYRIDRDTSFTMKLFRKDTTPPTVTLIRPGSGTLLPPGSATFTFTYQDQSSGTCDLNVGLGNFFLVKAAASVAASATPKEYALTTMMEEGTYNWKVDCRDAKGNKAGSPKWTVTSTNDTNATFLSPPAADDTANQSTALPDTPLQPSQTGNESDPNLLQGFYDALDRKAAFSMNEQEAADALEFEKTITNALKTIERLNRDVNDLSFRHDLSDDEKAQKAKAYKETLDNLTTQVPVNIRVIDDTTYVKYASEDDLAAIADQFYGNPLVKDELKDLQNRMTVSTTVMHVTLTYLDGSAREETLVVRNLKQENLSKDDLFYEYIPADLGLDSITFITPATRKDQDLYKYDDQEARYAYLIPLLVPFEKTQQISTIITKERLAPRPMTGTGNVIVAIATDFNPKTILVILLILGIITYLLTTTETFDRLVKKDKSPSIHFLIEDALARLNAGDSDGANLLLKEIQLTYETLPSPGQEEAYPKVQDLCGQMDVAYVSELIAQSMNLLAEEKHDDAIAAYAKIKDVFVGLRPHEQEQVYKNIIDLHNAILHHGTLD